MKFKSNPESENSRGSTVVSSNPPLTQEAPLESIRIKPKHRIAASPSIIGLDEGEKLEDQQKFVDSINTVELSREVCKESLKTFLDTLLPYSDILVFSEKGSILKDAELISGQEIKKRIFDQLETESPSLEQLIFDIPQLLNFKVRLEKLLLKILSTPKEKIENDALKVSNQKYDVWSYQGEKIGQEGYNKNSGKAEVLQQEIGKSSTSLTNTVNPLTTSPTPSWMKPKRPSLFATVTARLKGIFSSNTKKEEALATNETPQRKKQDPSIDPLHVEWKQGEARRRAQESPTNYSEKNVDAANSALPQRINKVEVLAPVLPDVENPSHEVDYYEMAKSYLPHKIQMNDQVTPVVANVPGLNNLKKENPKEKDIDDLFGEDLGEPQTLRENLQERLGDWRERLGKVTKKTKNKLESTLEKVGPHGNKLISLLTQGSEYLNTKVNNKAVRLFAAVGLVSAGAMAAYATPIVLASMAGVGLGMRIISAAGMYKLVRKQLDDKYKEWEKDGKKKNTLSIAGMEAGAVGIALFSGEMIGKAFELIASSDIVHEVATSIKNTANIESVKESWSKLLFGSDAPVSTLPTEEALASSASSPVIPTETTTTGVEAKTTTPLENAVAPTNADLQHVVKKGDNLWSLLRGDLSRLNFEGFNELTQKGQEKMIQEFVNKIDVPSGSKDLIRIGEKLDFNKYFRR